MNENLPYLRWCGHDWECCMEGGRLIHPEKPWVWYDKDASACWVTDEILTVLMTNLINGKSETA